MDLERERDELALRRRFLELASLLLVALALSFWVLAESSPECRIVLAASTQLEK